MRGSMSDRYVLQPDPSGWTIIDPALGTPVVFDGVALTGLKNEYAVEISEVLSLVAALLQDGAVRSVPSQAERRLS
jgi:hypothetical protein